MEGILEEEHKRSPPNSDGSSPTDFTGLTFPTKPQSRGMGASIQVVSNFYPIKVRDQRTALHAYIVRTTPQLTCHTNKEKETLKKLVMDRNFQTQLEEIIGCFVYFEGFVYSFERVDDSLLPTQSKTLEDVEYTISYEYH
jgi:hypothetical protein